MCWTAKRKLYVDGVHQKSNVDDARNKTRKIFAGLLLEALLCTECHDWPADGRVFNVDYVHTRKHRWRDRMNHNTTHKLLQRTDYESTEIIKTKRAMAPSSSQKLYSHWNVHRPHILVSSSTPMGVQSRFSRAAAPVLFPSSPNRNTPDSGDQLISCLWSSVRTADDLNQVCCRWQSWRTGRKHVRWRLLMAFCQILDIKRPYQCFCWWLQYSWMFQMPAWSRGGAPPS